MGRGSAELWVITCYFNPARSARKIANYRAFRKHLAAPLVAVELSFNGRFDLGERDADVVVRRTGGSVLWQKERLLNLALERVPQRCDKIAWVDCDVIFGSDDWVERAGRALDQYVLVHLFHERHDLPPDARAEGLRTWDVLPTSRSAVWKMAAGEAAPEDLFQSNAPLERRSTLGLAWASARPLLDQHGLYDACILGSGDRAILCAALGKFSYGERAVLMNARQAAHYRTWAVPYYQSARGRVGCIDGRLFHLWHGEREDRRYETRHRGLAPFDFDPFADIAPDEGGGWRWCSDKPALHAYVSKYFETRNEDGRPREALRRPAS